MKKTCIMVLTLLLLSAFVLGYASNLDEDTERTTIIGFVVNPEVSINWNDNIIFLRTYYFGDFIIKLPDYVSADDIKEALSYEHIKVTLEEPRSKLQYPFIDSFPPINAVMIEGRDSMTGKLINQTDDYIDIEIWTYTGDSVREGAIQRIILKDTSFSRSVPIGKNVDVCYEIDEEGNVIALLVTGFAGEYDPE